MKHLLTILSGLLVALLFARCADDDNLSGGIDGLPERGIVIRLSTGELDTRTQLTSTGDYHHVEEVWAVLYKLEGTDANDLNNYKLTGTPTKLGSMEDGQFVAWNPYKAPDAPKFNPADPDNPTDAEREKYEQELAEYNNKWGGEYGNGKIQGREFVLPESGAMQAGTYRVLCIGFDEASKTVYDLMSSEGTTLNTMIFGENKTLADAKATLTETKAYEEQTGTYQMYGYDGTGELFAGWTEFEFEPDNINIAEVELKRRVAGILCYVTDIPAKIENTEVKGIRLCLNTKANSEIGLCRLDKPWEDFGAGGGYSSEYAGGTTLAYQDLSDWTADGEILKKGEEGNLVMGAYIIPINVVEDNNVTNTLSVQLFGGDSYDYEDGNLGELIKTFNVLNEQGHSTERKETAERYNILPNYIYHIGDKDDDIDEPMSLLGQKITVKPKIWTDEEIPVEFPSVPIKPKLELVDKSSGLKYSNSYIFDCIGSKDELILEVYNPVVYTKWSLTTTTEGVYLFQDGKYGTSYIPTEADYAKSVVEIPIALTDYAQYRVDANGRQIPPEDDYRTLTITVEGASDPISFDILQYNALVVKFNNADGNPIYRGFSRYDWGTERDPQIGTITTNGKTYGWGYHTLLTCVPSYIFNDGNDDYDGYTNYQNAKRAAKDEWDDSAIHVCADNSYTYVNDAVTGGQLQEKEGGWYLPAYYELDAFLNAAGNAKNSGSEERYEAYNVRLCSGNNSDMNRYWSSTPVGGTALWSWAMWLNNAGRSSIDDQYSGGNERNHRDRYYYMRQCCWVVYP